MEQKDIDKLVDAIVSHERFDLLFSQVSKLTTHAESTDERLDALEVKVDRVIRSVERLASGVDDLMTEYAAIKSQMNRYDAWFKQIADHVGIELKN